MAKGLIHVIVTVSWAAVVEGAMAQAPQSGVTDSNVQTESEGTGGAAQANSVIEDIVVTAQKESRTLQRTPAAVTAITDELLVARGITDLVSAQNYVPSARLQSQGSSVEIYIRGIGSTNDFANTEPPTAFNINGVYIPREGGSTPFFDIERIEVLPGPQGTLYGRSALGGAVNVVFQRPTQKLETKAIAEVGNYGLLHGTAIQNVPISSNFAVRAGVDYTSRNGYFESGAGSADDLSGRLSLLFNPTENLTAHVWGFATRKRGNSGSFVNKGFNPDSLSVDGESFLHENPWNDTLTGPLAPFAVFGPVRAIPRHYNNEAIGAQIDLEFGDVTITAIPAYMELDLDQSYFLSALIGVYNAKIKSYSNELRVAGESDRLRWQTGLNVYRTDNSDASGVPPIFFNYVDRNRSEGLGLYAHLTYSVSDAFRVTAGGRYSSDSRTGRGRVTAVAGELSAIPWTADVESNRADWKFGFEYDAAPRVMLYATAQTGYQPATYNAFAGANGFDNRIDAPTITAYSGGAKSRFFDEKLQVNPEFFYYVYKGLPLQGVDLTQTFNPIFNAERVEIYGTQLDLVFQPTSNDQLTASVGYLHARQTEAIVPASTIFGSAAGQDFSGLQLQNAPDWTVNASYSHDFQIKNGYVRLTADTRYESSFFGVYTHAIGTRQDAYFMSNASLTYHSEDENWSLGAWIKNIEDEPVQAAGAAGGIPGPAVVYLQAPRTYGLRATVAF